MLYTEYRPKNFNELIGTEHIVGAIVGALAKNSAAHAYFFTGSRGIGKTSTARLLAKALNCTSPITTTSNGQTTFEPCNKCENCLAVSKGNHLDLIEIDAASNRGIDNIRELRDAVGFSPSMGKNKIYIIDEVHMLTTEASNALLKTLEEPPSHVYFILCTTNPEKVLDTIKSRCQQFIFKRPSLDQIVSKLKKIATDKKIEVGEEELRQIAVTAKGAFREAETILEQFIEGGSNLSQLLTDKSSQYFEFLNLLLTGHQADSIKFVYDIYSTGSNIETWTEKFIEYVRVLLLEKLNVVGIEKPFELSDLEKSLVQEASVENLHGIVQRFTLALREFNVAVIQTLPIEMAILELGFGGAIRQRRIAPDKTPPLPVRGSSLNVPKASSSSPKKVTPKSFPYQDLIQNLKPMNHSIHLLLHSCEMVDFDGKNLQLMAYYSFHKERLLSHKIRLTVEEEASKLYGSQIVINCDLSDAKPNAKRLTDKNVEEVFEKVFGDELQSE